MLASCIVHRHAPGCLHRWSLGPCLAWLVSHWSSKSLDFVLLLAPPDPHLIGLRPPGPRAPGGPYCRVPSGPYCRVQSGPYVGSQVDPMRGGRWDLSGGPGCVRWTLCGVPGGHCSQMGPRLTLCRVPGGPYVVSQVDPM